MSGEHENFLMVAAIDFGTTFSGYAFSFKTDKEKIMMNKNWGASVGFQSYKTPTCVLVDQKEEFDCFGYEAESKYGALIEEGTNCNGWAVFRHFKMSLHKSTKEGKLSRTRTLTSSNGSLMPAMDIFAMALKYLKQHLLKAVEVSTEKAPADHMIRWVITVPAIWSDESKQFMREAAFKASFMKSFDSKQLVIALEPEAASLYCRRLDVQQFMDRKDSLSFNSGIKYLVIDSGGGTVDVTAHEILQDKSVKELHTATGGAWGGTKVDENFINLLTKVLGEKFIKTYRDGCPQQWLQMMVNFERIKRAAKPDGKSTMNLQLSWAMGNKYAEVMKGKTIESVIKASNHLGISFNNGMLIIEYKAVKDLFEPVLKNITDHIEKLLQNRRLHPCKYFFLVGGFSESEFLQKAIRDKFGSRVDVLVPSEAQMSVIKGAVLFGHSPTEIRSRIARKTYGYKILSSFDPDIHKIEKKVEYDGDTLCDDIFRTFVTQEDEVNVGHTIQRHFTPAEADQNGMDIPYYCLDGKAKPVHYIDEPGMQKLANVHIDMPILTGGKERKVEVSITFGGTEIQINAIDLASGNKAATTLDFFAE